MFLDTSTTFLLLTSETELISYSSFYSRTFYGRLWGEGWYQSNPFTSFKISFLDMSKIHLCQMGTIEKDHFKITPLPLPKKIKSMNFVRKHDFKKVGRGGEGYLLKSSWKVALFEFWSNLCWYHGIIQILLMERKLCVNEWA